MKKLVITPNVERAAVEAAKNGNYDMFGRVVLAQRALIVAQAMKTLQNKEAAEDLFCDVYIKAQTSINQYDPNLCKLKTWLFRITYNTAIDMVRNKRIMLTSQNKNNYLLSDEGNRIDEKSWLPKTTQNEFFDSFNTLAEIVGNLPYEKRKLLEEKYWNEATYNELTEQFNMPIGTLKGTLFRARKEVKEALEFRGYTLESMV